MRLSAADRKKAAGYTDFAALVVALREAVTELRAARKPTTHDKALRIIGEERIRWDGGDVYLVLGDSADKLAPVPYEVRLSREGEPDWCSCVNPRTCSHIIAARLVQAVFRK